jgi:DNA modification methylase
MAKGRPELGPGITPAPRYSNDIWKIAQSMATVDLKTIGDRSSGLEHGGKQGHRVKEHPAAFPVELPRALIGFLAGRGELVIEPFCGAGSTIIAAEKCGRVCYAMDLVPLYVDVAIRRWEAFTGRDALDDAGRPYKQIALARGKPDGRAQTGANSSKADRRQSRKAAAQPA